MKRRSELWLVLLCLLMSCLLEDDLHLYPETLAPQDIADGLELGSLAEVGMDSKAIKLIYDAVPENEDLWSIRSMLILKDGKLVAEHYYKDPDDITQQHLIWSCTKQIMGLLVGVALDEGVIENIDDSISKYLESETATHPDKQNITIRQLLTMTSGIGYSNDGVNGQTDQLLRQLPENCIDFVLSLPLDNTPGDVFNYNDGDPLLLSAIIQNQTGMHTDEWANQKLFSKLGLTNYSWRRYKDGRTFGGFGIETTPRELAKIALCVQDSGSYKGFDIIDKEWLNSAMIEQVHNDLDFSFGYQWWLDKDRDLKIMWGHGGQLVFIDQGRDLVLIVTAIPNTQGKYQITAGEVLPIFDNIIKTIK